MKCSQDSLLALKLGWILAGPTSEIDSNLTETNMLILTEGTNIKDTSVSSSIDDLAPTKPNLEDFWNIESIGIVDNPKTSNDEKVTSRKAVSQGWKDQVTWLWKDNNPDLPLNRELAMGRLRSSVLRMRHKPEVMKQYDSIIQDQFEKRIIDVCDNNVDGMLQCLPHHAVINLQKPTTKLRIVYDASAKSMKRK